MLVLLVARHGWLRECLAIKQTSILAPSGRASEAAHPMFGRAIPFPIEPSARHCGVTKILVLPLARSCVFFADRRPTPLRDTPPPRVPAAAAPVMPPAPRRRPTGNRLRPARGWHQRHGRTPEMKLDAVRLPASLSSRRSPETRLKPRFFLPKKPEYQYILSPHSPTPLPDRPTSTSQARFRSRTGASSGEPFVLGLISYPWRDAVYVKLFRK